MLDIPGLMACLSTDRPVFHSEADFQHALAWRIHLQHPTARVRPERPVDLGEKRRAETDLWIEIDGSVEVIELKYQTVDSSFDVGGERFLLKGKGAEDNLGYDFLKDLVRVEKIVKSISQSRGHAILLSNEPLWREGSGTRECNKDAFRVHEGRELQGTLSWRDEAKAKARATAHQLNGNYRAAWREYSRLEGVAGRFRYLWLSPLP